MGKPKETLIELSTKVIQEYG